MTTFKKFVLGDYSYSKDGIKELLENDLDYLTSEDLLYGLYDYSKDNKSTIKDKVKYLKDLTPDTITTTIAYQIDSLLGYKDIHGTTGLPELDEVCDNIHLQFESSIPLSVIINEKFWKKYIIHKNIDRNFLLKDDTIATTMTFINDFDILSLFKHDIDLLERLFSKALKYDRLYLVRRVLTHHDIKLDSNHIELIQSGNNGKGNHEIATVILSHSNISSNFDILFNADMFGIDFTTKLEYELLESLEYFKYKSKNLERFIKDYMKESDYHIYLYNSPYSYLIPIDCKLSNISKELVREYRVYTRGSIYSNFIDYRVRTNGDLDFEENNPFLCNIEQNGVVTSLLHTLWGHSYVQLDYDKINIDTLSREDGDGIEIDYTEFIDDMNDIIDNNLDNINQLNDERYKYLNDAYDFINDSFIPKEFFLEIANFQKHIFSKLSYNHREYSLNFEDNEYANKLKFILDKYLIENYNKDIVIHLFKRIVDIVNLYNSHINKNAYSKYSEISGSSIDIHFINGERVFRENHYIFFDLISENIDKISDSDLEKYYLMDYFHLSSIKDKIEMRLPHLFKTSTYFKNYE